MSGRNLGGPPSYDPWKIAYKVEYDGGQGPLQDLFCFHLFRKGRSSE